MDTIPTTTLRMCSARYCGGLLVLIALCATLWGCTLANGYDRTASKLAQSLYEWRIPGDDPLRGQTPEESASAQMALRQCISDLSKEPPDVGASRELRTVKLLDCMKLK